MPVAKVLRRGMWGERSWLCEGTPRLRLDTLLDHFRHRVIHASVWRHQFGYFYAASFAAKLAPVMITLTTRSSRCFASCRCVISALAAARSAKIRAISVGDKSCGISL